LQKQLQKTNNPRGIKIQDKDTSHFETIEQVYEQAIHMISNAEYVLLVDALPYSLEKIQNALEQVSKKGVCVFVKVYNKKPVPGCNTIFANKIRRATKAWPGDFLNIVADGREHLIALLNIKKQKIIQAIKINNPYLSIMLHNGLINEFAAGPIYKMIYKKASRKEMMDFFKKTIHPYITEKTPGFKEFVKKTKIEERKND